MAKQLSPAEPIHAHIDSLSHDGRGVAHVDGKAVFISGALPGEEVLFSPGRRFRRFEEGDLREVLAPSPVRVEPRCAHFGTCGGCSLQHLASPAQLAARQEALLDNLERIGKVRPETVLEPMAGPTWEYRHRARLSVRYVRAKGRVLVGFRERRSSFVADLQRCEILHPSIGGLLPELASLIGESSLSRRIPQIEVAVGEARSALVFRHLDPLTEEDTAAFLAFGRQHDIDLYLQSGGPETIAPLTPDAQPLFYRHVEDGISIYFGPADFVQVNLRINSSMVRRVIELLQLNVEERVLDLFCGLGNVSLPLSRHAGVVVGIEGDAGLVARARENAARNGIGNVSFEACNLSQDVRGMAWFRNGFDKVVLDPPRTGAAELVSQIGSAQPSRIVYVSCNPATLARDAAELVHTNGYRLTRAGVMDMFPHTSHVESVACFVK